MKILVTGANGFLGSECAKQLRTKGHTVISTDRAGSVELCGDLSDESFVKSLPAVDAVLHSAGVQYFSPNISAFGRREYFHKNNTLATKNLTARYSGTGAHFVYVSTSMIYDPNDGGFHAVTSPKKANGVYSASKIAAEQFVEKMGNPFAVVVPCIIAGSGRGGLFERLVRSIKRFGIAPVPGKALHPVHIVHVEDVASLISLIVEKRATGSFNAGAPEPVSIRQWIDEIQSELKIPNLKRVHIPYAAVEFVSLLFGYTPLAREQLLLLRYPHVLRIEESLALGWLPRWNNAQTVRETARALALSAR